MSNILFTTYDNVDIYEKDNNVNGKGIRLYKVPFFAGFDFWNNPYKAYDVLILNDHSLRGKQGLEGDCEIFFCKEKAEEFARITLNWIRGIESIKNK